MPHSGLAVASNTSSAASSAAASNGALAVVAAAAAAAAAVSTGSGAVQCSGSISASSSTLSQIISLTSSAPRGSRGSSAESLYEEPTNSSAGTQSGDELCPMDLSSGGATGMLGGSTGIHPFAHPALLASPFMGHLHSLDEQSMINAKRLAELVKAQHLAHKQQREQNETTPPSSDPIHRLPKKRHWPDPDEQLVKKMVAPSEYESSPKTENEDSQTTDGKNKPLIPLELIRAKWESNATERASPDSAASSTPSISEQHPGREVKKRRLDALLNRKFGDSPSSSSVTSRSPPNPSPQPPSPETSFTPVTSLPKKINRRKQSNPMTPATTPPCLSVRPISDLYPNGMKEETPARPKSSSFPVEPVDRRPTESPKVQRQQDVLKSQILQLQLAQAALLSGVGSSGSNPDFIKSALLTSTNLMSNPATAAAAASANPLLYYGYYAQMFQGLQAQQNKLVEQLMTNSKNPGSGLHSPLLAPKVEPTHRTSRDPPSPKESRSEFDRFSYSGLRGPLSPLSNFRNNQSSPHSHSHMLFPGGAGGSTGGPLSPSSGVLQGRTSSPLSPSDEPRRRAPRALTGRHVRSGTGASPQTLEILRKKILERMKLKELLGENSHLYFGALNKRGKSGGPKKPQHRLAPHHQQLTAAAAAAMVALNGKHH